MNLSFQALRHSPMPIRLERWLLQSVRERRQAISSLSDCDLKQQALALRYDAMQGLSCLEFMPIAFALVSEAAWRIQGLNYYDVQLIGGMHLALERIVEMKTGEGKTLTAVLPAFLHALAGKGTHVATANDYLAQRDAGLMGGIYNSLGMTVSIVKDGDEDRERKRSYAADVTYGTLKTFGFDFLRDRLRANANRNELSASGTEHAPKDVIMRGLHFLLVDEADSNLIDEARTPLIIGISDSADAAMAMQICDWAAKNAPLFVVDRDFRHDAKHRTIQLSPTGIQRLRSLPETAATQRLGVRALCEKMENAIRAELCFHRDRQYVVKDGEIVIVDELTGRLAEGRKWQQGIHQAIEAKENLEVTQETRHGASVTIQSLTRRYPKWSGMTDTAWTSRREFRNAYRKRTVVIPTHRPVDRVALQTKIFYGAEEKYQALALETASMLKDGRAVLIGTRSIHQSELISEALSSSEIRHQVLNVHRLDHEAEIVRQAGRQSQVTVATNVAGRGTDIVLDDSVRKAGGLHVILTELHESQRIDRQLIGRASRQGDPGSYRIFLSLDDEVLLRGMGRRSQQRLLNKYRNCIALPSKLLRYFRLAQQRVEKRDLLNRMALLLEDQKRHKYQLQMGLDPFVTGAR